MAETIQYQYLMLACVSCWVDVLVEVVPRGENVIGLC